MLQDSERRLQCVLDLSSEYYWEQDENHRFTVYHPSGEPDPDLAALVGKTSWEFASDGPAGGTNHARSSSPSAVCRVTSRAPAMTSPAPGTGVRSGK